MAEVTLDDEPSAERAWEMLSLFSREGFAQPSPLANLLVDRVVADELGDADSAAVKALRRAVRSRFDERVSGGAIVRAIERRIGGVAGSSDSTPGVAGPADVTATAEPPTAPTSPPADDEARLARSATRGRGSRITLGDLVAAELLPADALLEAVVDGVTHAARLREGEIELDGAFYGSPSAASKALRKKSSWNGWVDWRYRGETLNQLRSRLAAAGQREPDAG